MKPKHSHRLHILITAALLLAPAMANSQSSYIKELYYNDDGNSIIRAVDGSNYLIYNHKSINTFFLFPDGGLSSDYMIITNDQLLINDFEIFDGVVYFCGEYHGEERTIAMLGHFSLEEFPYCDVYYDFDTSMTTFKKMDTYYVAQYNQRQIHVVMTAVDTSGYGTMVDAYYLGGDSWIFHSFAGELVNEIFDDVVLVDFPESRYVVFSSRETGPIYAKYSHTRVWLFDLPTIINENIFDYFNVCFETKKPLPSSPILLEELDSWFASASIIGQDTVLVNRFAYNAYSGSVEIKGYPTLDIKDIQYNSMNSFCLDVLTTATTPTTVDSYIYPVQEFYFDTNLPMYGHLYRDEDLNTLALVSPINNTYVASGHDVSGQHLRTYKYQFNNWTCSKMLIVNPTHKDYDYYDIYEEIYYKGYPKTIPIKGSTEGSKTITTKCPNNQ